MFTNDTVSVKYILALVNVYEKVSGASLNKDKTLGMWLGRWRGCSEEPGGLKWTTDFQKVYGVYIGTTGAVYMYLCVYVCVYVCIYACVCVYVCVFIWVYVCVYICVYVYVSVYVCMFASVCVYVCV